LLPPPRRVALSNYGDSLLNPQIAPPKPRTYTVNGLNQYLSAGAATFGYDGNGNLTSDGSSAYVYDVENRLVSASGATSAALRYDPLKLR